MDSEGGNQRRLTSPGRGINVEADVRPAAPAAAQRSLAWVRGLQAPAACITGTAGNDTKTDASGKNCMNGLAGNDRLDGRGGNDVIHGGTGNDTILGGNGLDSLRRRRQRQGLRGPGNNRLYGDAGTDDLSAGTAPTVSSPSTAKSTT